MLCSVKYDHIINGFCMPQFKGTSHHFHNSFIFFAVYERLLSRHTYFSKKQSSHLWTLSFRREKKKILSSSDSLFLSAKYRKLLVMFYNWLFINFSFLPNLSVFQTTSVSNTPLSKKIIALALLPLCLAFFSCPLISF